MFIGFADARYNRGAVRRVGMLDPGATLGWAQQYVATGDPAAWDAFESWHQCAATRVGPGRWAASVRHAMTPLAVQDAWRARRARHVVDTLGQHGQQQLLLRF